MKLKPGAIGERDAFGIIAPAGPVTPDELQEGIELIKASGHPVVLGRNIFKAGTYLAGDDEARLQDLHEMFLDRRVKAIMCARGGYGSLRLLDKLDYESIGKNAKVFIGYSDITALLLAIYHRTGLITFHGPVLRDLTKNKGRNWEALRDVLLSGREFRLDLTGARVVRPGRARGVLMGGNLSLLCHMMGTPFTPSLKGKILFLEERGETPYRLDRMATHLRLCGGFEAVSGILLGSFLDCGESSSIREMFSDILSGLGIPVVSGIPLGHGEENITVPVGVEAEMDTEEMHLVALETCTRPQ
ncbi:MAG: LD-carboxypeptidase [Deltaproteobacteria bacterium]|nr:LD-carboxypeptidase [Deltaproteobacteria bacterium]MBW2136130.1 LD-carboxypeptidase [Deltaproteobacteria bacterium]